MPLYDFECPDGHVFDDIVKYEVKTLACPTCTKEATRQISVVRIDWRKMGTDPDFPTCADKWAKMQEEKARKEKSYNLVHY